jgi:hypothetical protein
METLAGLPPTPDTFGHLALSGGQDLQPSQDALLRRIEPLIAEIPGL